MSGRLSFARWTTTPARVTQVKAPPSRSESESGRSRRRSGRAPRSTDGSRASSAVSTTLGSARRMPCPDRGSIAMPPAEEDRAERVGRFRAFLISPSSGWASGEVTAEGVIDLDWNGRPILSALSLQSTDRSFGLALESLRSPPAEADVSEGPREVRRATSSTNARRDGVRRPGPDLGRALNRAQGSRTCTCGTCRGQPDEAAGARCRDGLPLTGSDGSQART